MKTAELVQQVAGASADQASGLGLVGRAMSDVDQATQRNAAAAQQLAATAAELATQAEALQRALSRFRVVHIDEGRAPAHISPEETPSTEGGATPPSGQRKVLRVG